MREFTLIEMECNEAIFNYNNPMDVQVAGVILNEVSESTGLYSTPAVKVVREIEVEYTF